MIQIPFRADRPPLVATGQTECFARDMTATIGAEVPLATVQAKLAELNQWVPIDGDARRPVGQLVERNSTGPLRLGYGAWRDLLLGVQFRNGGGQLVTAGGRTMKNVAGYDLTKFMVGQCGVFGRIVTITTRTYRLPARAGIARFAPDGKVINRILPTGCRPQWALLTAQALWCGYLGDERTVEYCLRHVREFGAVDSAQRPVGEDVAHRAALWNIDDAGQTAFRAAVPPARIGEFVERAKPRTWVADAAFGVVRGAPFNAAISDAAVAVGGTVCSTHGAEITHFADSPAVRAILTRLKAAFDPGQECPSPIAPRA